MTYNITITIITITITIVCTKWIIGSVPLQKWRIIRLDRNEVYSTNEEFHKTMKYSTATFSDSSIK